MEPRLVRRSAGTVRRLLGRGVVIALVLLAASGAEAQTAPVPGVTVVDGLTVVTGPEGTIISVGLPGIALAVVLPNDPTGPSSFFEGTVRVDTPEFDVSASVLTYSRPPESSGFLGEVEVNVSGTQVSAFYLENCEDGGLTTSSSIDLGVGSNALRPGGGGTSAAAGTCPPPAPEPPASEPPLPSPIPGPDVPLANGPPSPADIPPAPVTPSPAETPPAVPEAPGPRPVEPAPQTPPPAPLTPAAPPVAGPVPGSGPVTGPVLPATAVAPPAAAVGVIPAVFAPAAVVDALAVAPAAIVAPAAGSPPAVVTPPNPTASVGDPSVPVQPALRSRITLTAFNRNGRAIGPPGVGITVAGTGFPVGNGRAAGLLAASPALAQQAADCDTVYFFFDGVRIGSARPNVAGDVRRSGLSVPGGTEPGAHGITATCGSAGTVAAATTNFGVTDASLHRSQFVTALHHVRDIDFSIGALLLSAAGALAMLLLIAFPAELFNTTLEEHYDEVRGWFGLKPRPPTAGSGVRNVALFVGFLALSGPLWFAMQGSSAFDQATVVGAVGLSLATTVVVLGSDMPTYLHLRRRYQERANVVALPGTLVVAVACVLLSRAVRFEPGYFYGLVGGLAFSRRLRRDIEGRLSAASVLTMVGLSIAAWIVLTPISQRADVPDPGVWSILLESVLGGIFWTALDSLVIALLPLRLLTGAKIFGWRKVSWAVLYGMTLFAFIHILMRPGTGYVSDTSQSPTVVVIGLFLGFAVLSFGFWGYFRFRAPRSPEKASIPA